MTDPVVPRATSKGGGLRRGQAAVALRLAGATPAEIAIHLGYASPRRAQQAIETALAAQLDPETREQQRTMTSQRLERLLKSVWSKAIDPEAPEHLPAVREARGLVDRYAKLWGLDEPTRVEVTNPTQSELERWVVSIVSQNEITVEEKGIFDMPILEGEVVEESI